MEIPFFDLTRQNKILAARYQEFVSLFLKRGQTILGEEVTLFEQEFATYIGTRFCVSCANATDALEMLLKALEIGPGDEVIVPAFGWVSVVSAVFSVGAHPVLAEIGFDGNIDTEKVPPLISKRTKAVLAIHLYGNPFQVKELSKVCDDHRLLLIEDCAQAHGAVKDGKKVGGFGHAAVFSFYPTKNLGAMGDAGSILTNDSGLAEELKMMRNYGRRERSQFDQVGRNSRMDELQAGLLRIKLGHLDGWNQRRMEIARQYDEVIGKAFQSDDSVYYKYVFRVREREKVMGLLHQAGIETDIYYPFSLDKMGFLHHLEDQFPLAGTLAEEVLSLPLFPELTNDEIRYICEQLGKFKNYFV